MPNDLTTGSAAAQLSDLKRSFEDRLKSIEVSEEEAAAERAKVGGRLIRDKIAGLFKVTDLVNTALKWSEEADKVLKNMKKDKLMETYFQISEQNEEGISRIKAFLTSASGNILFNKIIGIVDDSPPEQEMIDHLAIAMFNVVSSDFERFFDEHRHALSQIGRLTPQALTILADAKSWPRFQLDSHTTDGGIVRSEWNPEFSAAYARVKGIRDDKAVARIGHSIFELQTARLVLSAKDNEEGFRAYYTDIGNEVRKYLQLPRL